MTKSSISITLFFFVAISLNLRVSKISAQQKLYFKRQNSNKTKKISLTSDYIISTKNKLIFSKIINHTDSSIFAKYLVPSGRDATYTLKKTPVRLRDTIVTYPIMVYDTIEVAFSEIHSIDFDTSWLQTIGILGLGAAAVTVLSIVAGISEKQNSEDIIKTTLTFAGITIGIASTIYTVKKLAHYDLKEKWKLVVK